MKKLLSLFILCVFSLLSYQAFAQDREVTGKVTDAKTGLPVQSATVKVKGANIATATDADGNFRIVVPAANKFLIFSIVGYGDREIEISGTSLNVQMAQSTQSLNEVVVVGYGTKIKKDLTGSVAKVGAKELNNTPVTSFESALQGRAAGVQVSQQNGKLGQGINVRVRGASSVSAGNEPLYVVDGVPVITADLSSNGATTSPLADINMNDIESIEILKDASAAAIYGSRGSNGVVLITTKKGKNGTSKIEAGAYTGFQKPTRKRSFLTSQEYIEFFKRSGEGAARQDFAAGYFNTIERALLYYEKYIDRSFTLYSAGNENWETNFVNTDWQSYAFQDAPMTQADLSISGGNEKTKFFTSGQFLDQKGIMIANKYKRYNARVNLDHKVRDWINIGINVSFARSQNDRVSNDNQFSTPLQVVALSPITPYIDPRTGLLSGELDTTSGLPNTRYPIYYNPLLSAKHSTYQTLVNRTLGDVYANINLTKNLVFTSELGIDQLNQTEESYDGSATGRNTGTYTGYGYYAADQLLNINTNNFLQYTKTFADKHDLEAVAGTSFQKQTHSYVTATGEAFPSDAFKKIVSAATKTDASSVSSEFSFLSYFLRANYKYNDKYLLSVSGRIDGSSRFGKNERYGFFPAVSAGWILSEEKFLENSSWIDFMKLKASYGLTGNAEISDFASRGLYSGNGSYGGNAGTRPTQIANPNLKWETTRGFDVGIEAAVFNNRVTLEMDYYTRKTVDLLLEVEVPGTSGFETQFRNIGKLENKGLEITLNTVNIDSKKFRWTTSLNFANNKNTITNLGGQVIGTDVNKAMEGQPLGVFFAREFAGADPDNGDALYYLNTKKTDGTLDRSTTNDYNAAQDVVIGSPVPDFIYGIGNTFTFKNLDLDVLLQGIQGNEIFQGGGQYMSASGSNGFDNQSRDQLAAWKQPGDITMVPEARMFYANGTNNSSRYISDGSFLRVKSISLSYTFPPSLLKKMKIEKMRIYARAQNLFTITKYDGWDPEVNADAFADNITQGNDFYSAPQVKTVVFGLTIGL